MSRTRAKTVPCPNCGQPVEWSPDSRWRPFCSERCRAVDLGDWFNEKHRVPGEPAPPQDPDPDH